MATLIQDDKQNQAQSAQGGSSPADTGLSGLSPGGFSSSGGPMSNVSTGAGGTNGWTNIQAYLNANQGDTSSASALNNTVGSQFNQERQNIDQSSGQAKSAAQAQVDKNNVSQDKASQLISEAGSNYNYNGDQNQTYQNDVGQLTGALGAQYAGPTQYEYGLGAKTQNYGGALGNDQGFQGMMGDIYKQASGGTMGQGALTLQRQLDQDNAALNNSRQGLLSQYADLGNYSNQSVADTQSALDAAKQNFGANQDALRSNLNTMGTSDQSAINDKVQAYDDYLTNFAANHNFGNQWQGMSGSFNRNSGPDATNVANVESQRNQWNAIQDALSNGGSKINYAGPWDANNAMFTVSPPGGSALQWSLAKAQSLNAIDPNTANSIRNLSL
jgi:hypothetical protein